MIIGLPEHAIAVDKAALDIIATTGIGFKDESVEDLGIRKENLTEDFSGFLKINGQTYYAGVSETAEMYLVPIVRPTASLGNLKVSLWMTLCTALTSLIILLLTLCGYQRVVLDGAPAAAEEKAPPSQGLLSGISNLIPVQDKWGMEERWGMESVPGDKKTPEQRISRIVYRLLLVFCLFILLPTLYVSLDRNGSVMDLGNLAYVISGNWQKGFNIFALTACVFLLCAMYVSVVLLNRILYLIARVSDMRVETVCLLLKNAMKYICVVIFVYYGLAQFGVDTKTLLASAGILSLMISFGAKDLVGDIIAGFFTLLEGSYKVGDFVTVGSWSGTVTEIGLRTTKVNAFAETKIFNNSSMRDIVNSDGKVARMVLNAPVSYNADLAEVEAILGEELPKMTDRIPGLLKPVQYEGVDSLGDSAVNLRIVIFVRADVRYPALRALNREIKLLFDRRGIEIPFNQIVVHQAQETAGNREVPII
jgi:small conductance mechanosensitive channel